MFSTAPRQRSNCANDNVARRRAQLLDGFAYAHLLSRLCGEWLSRGVPVPLHEPKAAERDEQWELLRKDAPELERCDDEVGLGVSREVPSLARNLRGRIVKPSHINADVSTLRITERQRLPSAPHAIGFGE